MTSTHQPKTYRKRPVVIQAMVWDDSSFTHSSDQAYDIVEWINRHAGPGTAEYDSGFWTGEAAIYITTLEGRMEGSVGDYFIRGVAGEFYPCKPGVFAQTYEEALADTTKEADHDHH